MKYLYTIFIIPALVLLSLVITVRANEFEPTEQPKPTEIRVDSPRLSVTGSMRREDRREDRRENRREDRQENRQEDRTELRDRLRTTGTQARCSIAEKRIAQLIERYEKNEKDRKGRYASLVRRLQNLAQKLSERGYDISGVQAVAEELSEKITQRAEAYSVYIDLLRETQQFACGESEGEFKTALEEARQQLATVQVAQQEIETFVREEVKPALEELKSQKKVSPTQAEDEL